MYGLVALLLFGCLFRLLLVVAWGFVFGCDLVLGGCLGLAGLGFGW